MQPDRADFRAFFLGLSQEDREALATRAEYRPQYIRIHLAAPAGRRKVPKKDGMDRLFAACQERGATFTKAALVAWFYESPPESVA